MKKRRMRKAPKKQDGKRQAKKRIKRLQRRVFETLELPEELVSGVPKATLYGRERLLIENHRGVLEYREDRARIATDMGVVCITGGNLALQELGSEQICISGRIGGCLYEG